MTRYTTREQWEWASLNMLARFELCLCLCGGLNLVSGRWADAAAGLGLIAVAYVAAFYRNVSADELAERAARRSNPPAKPEVTHDPQAGGG